VRRGLRISLLPGRFAVCRLDAQAPLPPAIAGAPFLSITRTAAELSIVCAEAQAPAPARVERGWRCLALRGPIPFSATGVLAAMANPLALAGVGIFAVSTFDTDYVLVKQAQLAKALAALRAAGHVVAPAAPTRG
jgi:hypothetical protein